MTLWNRLLIGWFSKSDDLIGSERHLAIINLKTLLSSYWYVYDANHRTESVLRTPLNTTICFWKKFSKFWKIMDKWKMFYIWNLWVFLQNLFHGQMFYLRVSLCILYIWYRLYRMGLRHKGCLMRIAHEVLLFILFGSLLLPLHFFFDILGRRSTSQREKLHFHKTLFS